MNNCMQNSDDDECNQHPQHDPFERVADEERANFFDFNFAGLLATYWLPVVKVAICPRCCRYSALVRSTRI